MASREPAWDKHIEQTILTIRLGDRKSCQFGIGCLRLRFQCMFIFTRLWKPPSVGPEAVHIQRPLRASGSHWKRDGRAGPASFQRSWSLQTPAHKHLQLTLHTTLRYRTMWANDEWMSVTFLGCMMMQRTKGWCKLSKYEVYCTQLFGLTAIHRISRNMGFILIYKNHKDKQELT